MKETAGYKAKKEIEKIIYDDSGIYKFRQYKKAKAIKVLTAYDEIKILWDQELKYREGFAVKDDTVSMPVVFAKVNGVFSDFDYINTHYYWNEVKDYMTENAIVYKNKINIRTYFFEKLRLALSGFLSRGKLNVERLRSSKVFKYYSLPDYMREHILENIKYVIDNKIIKNNISKNTDFDILAVALKLPQNIIKRINEFDFTKRNPKIVFITDRNRILSVSEAILLVLLYYIGFDILIFAPNGVSNIEYLLNNNIIQVHEIGEHRSDVKIPFFNLLF